MPTVHDISQYLQDCAPLTLAEEWDNVGLLVGKSQRSVARLMTCLTITPASLSEAVERQADLIVTHHPLPFRPVKSITAQSTVGALLLELIESKVAVYSAHTAYDSASAGINQSLAEGLQLEDIKPLVTHADNQLQPSIGSGRFGKLAAPMSTAAIALKLKDFLGVAELRAVGADEQMVHTLGLACGSGGTMLEAAQSLGCDCFITGETNFHTCLQAEAVGTVLLLAGHFASERFAVVQLAKVLNAEFPNVDVWACETEADPLRTV